MSHSHKFYLGLGSNIEPRPSLVKAVRGLESHGLIQGISNVWESHAYGSRGPNFLNICVSFVCPMESPQLKEDILLPLEEAMGRRRTRDKNAPRTIDVDILLVDDQPQNLDRWSHAFVVVPLADLIPDFQHPLSGLSMRETARKARADTWIVRRPKLL